MHRCGTEQGRPPIVVMIEAVHNQLDQRPGLKRFEVVLDIRECRFSLSALGLVWLRAARPILIQVSQCCCHDVLAQHAIAADRAIACKRQALVGHTVTLHSLSSVSVVLSDNKG